MEKEKTFSIILVLTGTVFILLGVFDYANKKQTENFQTAGGYITEFKVTKNTKGGDKTSITYSYVVNGTEYMNNRISYGLGNPLNYKKYFQNKTKLLVYYNENNPQDSVLIQGVSLAYLGIVLIGICILVIGFVSWNKDRSTFFKNIWDSMFG